MTWTISHSLGRRPIVCEVLGPDGVVLFEVAVTEGAITVDRTRIARGPGNRTAFISSDARAIDTRPDTCWRCDAAESETNVGLCSPCHQALTA